MPFDNTPLYETEVYSLDGLIAWLRMQPPEKGYRYWDVTGGCLLGQYLAHRNVIWSGTSYGQIATCYGLPADRLIGNVVARQEPWTFGAALERAEVLARERAREVVG